MSWQRVRVGEENTNIWMATVHMVHPHWFAVTRQEDRRGGPALGGRQRHKARRRQDIQTVPSPNLRDCLPQYDMTNLSSVGTIRRRQKPPVIWRREGRLTWQEKRGGIKKIRPVREEGTRLCHLSRGLSLCAFHFQVSKGCRKGGQAAKRRPALDRGSCPVLSQDQSGEAG